MTIVIGKPGDPCVEGDGRASLDGWWCGACHVAANLEMLAAEQDRIEAGYLPCTFFERQPGEPAVGMTCSYRDRRWVPCFRCGRIGWHLCGTAALRARGREVPD